MIDVQFDLRRTTLAEIRAHLGEKNVNKALRWALDASTRKAATFISRDIRGTYAVKAAQVKAHLKIKRVERDAARLLLYAGQALPLAQFAPRPKVVRVQATSRRGKKFNTRRRGVTLKIRKDKPRGLASGAWHAKGHILRQGRYEDPYIQYGPSIPGMVAHPATMDQAQALVREDLPREFAKRLEYILGKEG